MCSKRCNSNDAISVFEILARELRATLLSNLSSRGLRGLTAGPDCGARGRRRGPAGSCPAPPDWRPPRGLRGLAGSFPAPPDWRPPRGLRGPAGSCPAPPDWRPPRGLRGPAGSCPAPPDWRPPRGLRGPAGSCPAPADWRPPRGLRGLAGLRDDAPSEARSANGERAGRPRGGWKSGGARSTKVVAPRKTWEPPLMRSLA